MSEKKDNQKLKETVKELNRITKMLLKRDLELAKTREKLENYLEQLEEKNKELVRINKLMVGRELRMKELKEQNKKLKKRLKN